MKKENKTVDQIPETFASYDEAGEYWDTHDSSQFLADLIPVAVEAHLEKRHFEIEVDEEIARALDERARARKLRPDALANQLLKRELALT